MTLNILAALFMMLGTVSALLQASNRFVLARVVDGQSETPVPGLGAEDFIVQEGATRCDTVGASPAQYPVAILVDTSPAARPQFSEMRKAVRHLAGRLSGRDVALYTFGDRSFRVVDDTRDTARLERLQRRLAAEVIVEYVPAGSDAPAPLRIGTRVPGGTVLAIGLDRAPR